MSLDDFVTSNRRKISVEQTTSEHYLIDEVLDEVFESGFVDSLIRDELEQQFRTAGISVEPNATLPNAPYSWDATGTLKETWPVFVTEYILSDESRCDRRYQQASARATEHLSCSAPETVKSALSRRTFYEQYDFNDEKCGTVEVSAPSAELIRDILDEVERLLRSRESDIIEQIKAEHEIHVCQKIHE
ncbi:hypothetical protein [Haloferax volcanii]|uniref:hypothetical protein n=1 Tax=Haloferax volcanii TaxID=2246 RepID=UPI0038545680